MNARFCFSSLSCSLLLLLRCLCTLPCYYTMKTCIMQLSTNNFWRIRAASELVHVPRTSLPEDFPPYMLLPNRALRAWAALMPSLQSIVHGWRESPWRGTQSEYQQLTKFLCVAQRQLTYQPSCLLSASNCCKQGWEYVEDKNLSSRPAPSNQL